MSNFLCRRLIPAICFAVVVFFILLYIFPEAPVIPPRADYGVPATSNYVPDGNEGDFATTAAPVVNEAILMSAIFAFLAGVMLFFASGRIKKPSLLILVGAAILAGMVIRTISLAQWDNGDYRWCLRPWVQDFRVRGWDALVNTRSDYNVVYLYIVGLISRIPVSDLYLYKLVSILCDCGIAMLGLRLACTFKLGDMKKVFASAALFLAPTVWLNSSFWGQCDAVFAVFCLLALVFILEKKPPFAAAAAAVALSFKLQAIFLLPIFIVLCIAKRVRWWSEVQIFIGTFFVTILPAWLMGRPLWSILSIYGDQTKNYASRLNWNSTSMYALIPDQSPEETKGLLYAGIILAFCLVGALALLAWHNRTKLTDKVIFLFAVVMVIGIPWLLPKMHDRYFFLADIFCVFLAVMIPEKWFFGPLCVFASYAAYRNFLFMPYTPDTSYIAVGSVIMMFLLGSSIALLVSELKKLPDVPVADVPVTMA